MKFTNRVKRLEQVKGGAFDGLVVAWIDEDKVRLETSGEDTNLTLSEWESEKAKLKELDYIEVEWV